MATKLEWYEALLALAVLVAAVIGSVVLAWSLRWTLEKVTTEDLRILIVILLGLTG